MPVMCSVSDCKNVQHPDSSLAFHRFPADSNIRKQWIDLCKRKETVNPVTARICSDHFGKEDYERDTLNELLGLPVRKILKRGVIPSKFQNREKEQGEPELVPTADVMSKVKKRKLECGPASISRSLSNMKKTFEFPSVEDSSAHPNCLICYSDSSDSRGSSKAKDGESEKDLLKLNENVMFIMEKILDLPRGLLQELETKCGSPRNWIGLCGDCVRLAKEGLEVEVKISELKMKFQKIQTEVVGKMKESQDREFLRDKSSWTECYATQATRRFVTGSKFDLFYRVEGYEDEVAVFGNKYLTIILEDMKAAPEKSRSSSPVVEVKIEDDIKEEVLSDAEDTFEPLRPSSSESDEESEIRVQPPPASTSVLDPLKLPGVTSDSEEEEEAEEGESNVVAKDVAELMRTQMVMLSSSLSETERRFVPRIFRRPGEGLPTKRKSRAKTKPISEVVNSSAPAEVVDVANPSLLPPANVLLIREVTVKKTKATTRSRRSNAKKAKVEVPKNNAQEKAGATKVPQPIPPPNPAKTFNCPMCPSLGAMDFEVFLNHVSFHKRRPKKCVECSVYLGDEFSVKNHWEAVHVSKLRTFPKSVKVNLDLGKIWTCSVCKKIFRTELKREEHQATVHRNLRKLLRTKGSHKCGECSKTYGDLNEWRLHRALEHPEVAALSCWYCDERVMSVTREGIEYLDKNLLNDHLLAQHGFKNMGTEVCDYCGLQFPKMPRLAFTGHINKVHGIPYKWTFSCEICHRGFEYYDNLLTHFKKQHRQTTHFCKECEFETVSENLLQQHILMKHSAPTTATVLKCTHEGCSYETMNQSNFKKHLETHNPDRKLMYICNVCKKGFASKQYLRSHEQIHDNAETRPFQCEICGVSFAVKVYLRNHKLAHHSNASWANRKTPRPMRIVQRGPRMQVVDDTNKKSGEETIQSKSSKEPEEN